MHHNVWMLNNLAKFLKPLCSFKSTITKTLASYMILLINIAWTEFTINQSGLLSGCDDKEVEALITDFRFKPLFSLLSFTIVTLWYQTDYLLNIKTFSGIDLHF